MQFTKTLLFVALSFSALVSCKPPWWKQKVDVNVMSPYPCMVSLLERDSSNAQYLFALTTFCRGTA
jgi:hypothetical protein